MGAAKQNNRLQPISRQRLAADTFGMGSRSDSGNKQNETTLVSVDHATTKVTAVSQWLLLTQPSYQVPQGSIYLNLLKWHNILHWRILTYVT